MHRKLPDVMKQSGPTQAVPVGFGQSEFIGYEVSECPDALGVAPGLAVMRTQARGESDDPLGSHYRLVIHSFRAGLFEAPFEVSGARCPPGDSQSFRGNTRKEHAHLEQGRKRQRPACQPFAAEQYDEGSTQYAEPPGHQADGTRRLGHQQLDRHRYSDRDGHGQPNYCQTNHGRNRGAPSPTSLLCGARVALVLLHASPVPACRTMGASNRRCRLTVLAVSVSGRGYQRTTQDVIGLSSGTLKRGIARTNDLDCHNCVSEPVHRLIDVGHPTLAQQRPKTVSLSDDLSSWTHDRSSTGCWTKSQQRAVSAVASDLTQSPNPLAAIWRRIDSYPGTRPSEYFGVSRIDDERDPQLSNPYSSASHTWFRDNQSD
jgi:hypothetical protein